MQKYLVIQHWIFLYKQKQTLFRWKNMKLCMKYLLIKTALVTVLLHVN